MKLFEVKYFPGAIAFLESLEKAATEKLIFNISNLWSLMMPGFLRNLKTAISGSLRLAISVSNTGYLHFGIIGKIHL